MTDKNTIEGILQRAIRFEEDANSFYLRAKDMVELPHVKDILQELADEEVTHKEKLQELLAGDTSKIVAEADRARIEDLKLADYLVPRPIEEGATLQDVLIVAMQREKSSYDFYTNMAEVAGDDNFRELFGFLAQEELGHKNKVERIYDDFVHQDN